MIIDPHRDQEPTSKGKERERKGRREKERRRERESTCNMIYKE